MNHTSDLLAPLCRWNKTDCAYKIVKVPVAEEVDDYDEYLFVVRSRVGKSAVIDIYKAPTEIQYLDRSTDKVTKYIDIKSAVIRDVLRVVLKDVRGISLNEDRPSVMVLENVYFVPSLTSRRSNKTSCSTSCPKSWRIIPPNWTHFLRMEHLRSTWTSCSTISKPNINRSRSASSRCSTATRSRMTCSGRFSSPTQRYSPRALARALPGVSDTILARKGDV